MSYALTQPMREMLDALKALTTEDSAPTFDEIMAYTGRKSKSDVHRLLTALEERGHIVRLRARRRAIQLVDTSYTEVVASIARLPKAYLPALRQVIENRMEAA